MNKTNHKILNKKVEIHLLLYLVIHLLLTCYCCCCVDQYDRNGRLKKSYHRNKQDQDYHSSSPVHTKYRPSTDEGYFSPQHLDQSK